MLHTGVRRKILLQLRVAIDILVVVQQRWIFGNLRGKLRVFCHEVAEAFHVPIAIPVPVTVTVATVFPPIITALGAHKGSGVFSYLLANLGMILKIIPQFGVLFHKLFVSEEGRISSHLLGNFWMAIQEPIEAGKFSACGVAVATTAIPIPVPVTIPVSVPFRPLIPTLAVHESARVFFYFLAHPRMVLKIIVQRGMLFYEFFVVDEGRVSSNLLRNFRVTIEELIETGHFTAGSVVVILLGIVLG
ncbi:MAG: hypothetical protein JOY93_03655 [Acidobacteriales bacterium]|nr:hypothetical protein [Terriglobales bacterium]